MQSNVNKPDICYSPTSPMQSVLPAYSIPASAPPMQPHMYPLLPIYTAQTSPIQPRLYPLLSVLLTQTETPCEHVLIPGNFILPQTARIRDYMDWSIINVFLGGFLLGFIAVYFSMQTKERKKKGDIKSAKTMSKITFTCNILITILFFILTAYLIIYFVYFVSLRNLA